MTKTYIKLFPNSFKKKGSSSPDYIVYVSEKDKDLKKIGAMWKRESKAGNFYYSGVLEMAGVLEMEGEVLLPSLKKKPSTAPKDLTRKKAQRKIQLRKGEKR